VTVAAGRRLYTLRHKRPKWTRAKINYCASKTVADLWLPMVPDLLAAIAAAPNIGLTSYLVNDYGEPFPVAGLGNMMRKWCDEANLPQCTAHGLRKAIARHMVAVEATQQQMKAVGGWKGHAEVATYVADAAQE